MKMSTFQTSRTMTRFILRRRPPIVQGVNEGFPQRCQKAAVLPVHAVGAELNLYFSLHDAVHVSGRRAVGCNVLGWRCVPPRLTYWVTETDIPSLCLSSVDLTKLAGAAHAQCQNTQKTIGLIWPQFQARLSCITGRFTCVSYFLTLKMEATSFFETSTYNCFATSVSCLKRILS